jgi:hypothetical protein
MALSIQSGSIADRDVLSRGRSFYPSQIFSLADFHRPRSIKDIFQWCRYFVLSDPAISGIIHKMAEAPITELIVEDEHGAVQKRWEDLLQRQLRVREKMLEAGMDMMAYSNAFLSLEKPVTRFLISPNVHPDIKHDCRAVEGGKMKEEEFDIKYAEAMNRRNYQLDKRYRIERLDWTFSSNKFKGKCPITGKHVVFERQDRYYPNAENMYIKRWDPNRITIFANEFTDQNEYHYEMKHRSKELIRKADRDMLCTVPWPFIEAALESRDVKFDEGKLLHLTNAKVSGLYDGWALPRLYSAFKYIFYYMTLLRSNEATARGKINDLNILFPQTQTGTFDPATVSPGASFMTHILSMLRAHKKDPNFVGVAPFPIGVASVFGQGRMNLLSAELEPVIRLICVALGLPYDMLFGGGNFSGMAVTQRLFTAQTGLHRERFNEALQFFVDSASADLGADKYPSSVSARLKEIEGPDDIQKKQARMNLALNGRGPLRQVFVDLDMDPEKAFEQMMEERKKMNEIEGLAAKGQAHAQAEGQEIMMRSQMRLQEEQAQAQLGPMAGQPGMMPPEEGMGQDPGQEQVPGAEVPPQEVPPQQAEADEQGKDQEAQLQHQVQTLMRYIQQNPDPEMQGTILQYAKVKYPEAAKVIEQMINQENGTVGEVPSAESPMLDYQQGDFESDSPSASASGFSLAGPTGRESGGPAQSGQQKSLLPGVSDGLPEQRPPRRETGGF